MEIKNWKEYPKVQEVKEKFENEKVRSSMRWVFQIMVTPVSYTHLTLPTILLV